MSIIIKARSWLNGHGKSQQWAWFLLLWLAGLVAVLLLASPFKLLLKLASP